MRQIAGRLAWLVLLGAMVLAGCGGTSDQTKGLSPQQIRDKSRAAAAQVTYYHPHLELDLDVAAASGATGFLARLSGTPVTIVADGPVRRPIAPGGAAFELATTAQLGPIKVQGTITKVPEGVYLTVAGTSFKLSLPADQANAVRIPPEPVLFMENPQEVGREDVNGVPTVHLRGTVATDALVDYVVGLLRSAPALLGGRTPPTDAQVAAIKEQLRSAVTQSSSEVWIGTKDLLPHKVAAQLVLKGPVDVLPGILSTTLAVRADVSGFNQEETITAPANAVPFSLNALLSALGGGLGS